MKEEEIRNVDFEYIINKAKRLLGNEYLLLKNAILMEDKHYRNKDYSKGYIAGKKFKVKNFQDALKKLEDKLKEFPSAKEFSEFLNKIKEIK